MTLPYKPLSQNIVNLPKYFLWDNVEYFLWDNVPFIRNIGVCMIWIVAKLCGNNPPVKNFQFSIKVVGGILETSLHIFFCVSPILNLFVACATEAVCSLGLIFS